jgi:hypothetical protein
MFVYQFGTMPPYYAALRKIHLPTTPALLHCVFTIMQFAAICTVERLTSLLLGCAGAETFIDDTSGQIGSQLPAGTNIWHTSAAVLHVVRCTASPADRYRITVNSKAQQK